MIPEDIIKKIRRIHIKGSRVVNSVMAGQYKSVFRGSGIEFEEVREYSPGDEVKSIDWKVSARLGKPFIKLYKEERESIVMLLIDMSASLKFGTLSMKLEKAAEVASVLAFSAIKNNDKVGAIFFTDRVEKYIPPKKGAGHIWRLITEIFTFSPDGTGTNIEAAIEFLSSVSRKKTLSFVISDFICNDFVKTLRASRQRHEFIGVIIYDKGEFELPEAGIVSMRCFETGDNILIDAGDRASKERYFKLRQSYHNQIIDRFKSAKVDSVEISTEHSVADTLIKYFKYREKRMRLM
ncbi:MAG: DUF58 domain-containing protein [Desulfamplus sp.]|nr:DUF58 domain-containing protein [Desulfamplus sp.]